MEKEIKTPILERILVELEAQEREAHEWAKRHKKLEKLPFVLMVLAAILAHIAILFEYPNVLIPNFIASAGLVCVFLAYWILFYALEQSKKRFKNEFLYPVLDISDLIMNFIHNKSFEPFPKRLGLQEDNWIEELMDFIGWERPSEDFKNSLEREIKKISSRESINEAFFERFWEIDYNLLQYIKYT